MDTKALRQKILDLAIRGKLVPQDPNDESASVLLERIRAEKQQMVKDGKLKAKDLKNDTIIFVGDDNLHYEKFSDGTILCIEDEIPYKEPPGWIWSRIGSFFNTITGNTPSTKDSSLYGNEFPFYKPTDLDAGFYVIKSLTSVSKKGFESSRQVPILSVLVTCIGATIGKTGLVRKPGICNQQINAILPNGFSNAEYTYYCMCSNFHQQQIISNSSATTLPILNKGKFDNLLYLVPPLNEQVRIANKINNIFEIIESAEKQQISLKELTIKAKNKILDLAIRGKLVPQDSNDEPASVLLERIRQEKEELIKSGKLKRDKRESIIFRGEDNSYYEKFSDGTIRCIQDDIPFVLPPGWCWERLGNVSSIARGGSPRPIDDYLTNSPEGVNWIKIGDTEKDGKYIYKTKEKIKPEGVIKSRFVRNGDFLLTNSMSFGRPYILKTDGCIHDGWLVIGEIEKAFDQDFLYYCLSSKFMFSELSKVAAGSTVQNLKSDTVKNVLFPIPPLKEQKGISKRIIELFSILTDIEGDLM